MQLLACAVMLLSIAVGILAWRVILLEKWLAKPLDKYIRDTCAQEAAKEPR